MDFDFASVADIDNFIDKQSRERDGEPIRSLCRLN